MDNPMDSSEPTQERLMTARQRLERHRWRILPFVTVGGIMFIAGIVLSKRDSLAFVLCIIGFAVLFGYRFIWSVRCARCGKRLDGVFSLRGPCTEIPGDIRYCPYCGYSLDERPEPKQNA